VAYALAGLERAAASDLPTVRAAADRRVLTRAWARVAGVDSPPPGPARVRLARTSAEPLSVDAALAAVRGPAVGGIGLFVGVVRDVDGGRSVAALDYTAHPRAEAMLHEVATRVAAAHQVEAVAVEHRTGHLEIGDLAVVVAAGARHRAAALEACRQLIDDLKAEVPIWKEQHFRSGVTEWLGLP